MLFLRQNKKDISDTWLPDSLVLSLEVAGFEPYDAVQIKHNTRAKRLSLRMNVKKRCVILTFPASATWRQAQEFVDTQQDWILTQLKDTHEQTIAFKEGIEFPILGVPHKIITTGKLRGACYREDGKIYVSGTPEHLQRRIVDYLKKEARLEISWRAREKAQQINKDISHIRIGDTTSRWGSCTSKGVLSFSWRLILAPEDRLDYVVAHEVAHLQHMNHSKDFWQVCESLTSANIRESRNWFKTDGVTLFSYAV